jgi:hypothetical protein
VSVTARPSHKPARTTVILKFRASFLTAPTIPLFPSLIYFQAKWLVRVVAPQFSTQFTIYGFLTAIYTVYTSPNHPSVPNHLPTLIVTPHGAFKSHLCDYGARSNTLWDLQGSLPTSSIRIFTRTLYGMFPIVSSKVDLTTAG